MKMIWIVLKKVTLLSQLQICIIFIHNVIYVKLLLKWNINEIIYTKVIISQTLKVLMAAAPYCENNNR